MQDVTKDRDKYIGGSDIAAILNISKFKTRWQLLKEKAGVEESSFTGNVYTEYGNELEPKIREYVNAELDHHFVEGKVIEDYLRYHADGVDFNDKCVLEIKTTSDIHDDIWDYKHYLCQLLMGMWMYNYKLGILAVYHRPDDFDTNFDSNRLQIYTIRWEQFEEFWGYVYLEIKRFREDWLKLMENPFMTEEEFQPKEIVEIADKVLILESQLEIYKQIEKEYKDAKASLKAGMEKYNIKTWTTPGGTKITLVPDGEPTEQWDFDKDKFAQENPDLYTHYLKRTTKKGKAGYVRITAGEK
nr:MAG TPA: Exonuclease [Caudoviricetes sp.]